MPQRDNFLVAQRESTRVPHQNAVQFMSHYHEVVDECERLAASNERKDATIETQGRELDYIRAENAKLRIERDIHLRGYEALRAQLGIIGTEALAFAGAVTKALEERKHEILRAGIDPDAPSEREDDIDDAIAQLGAKFGANNRAPQGETAPDTGET
jgi:predicted nuclease with TOPRIM domain